MEPIVKETHSCGVCELAYICTSRVGGARDQHFRSAAMALGMSRARGLSANLWTGPAAIYFVDVKYKDKENRDRFPMKNGESGKDLAMVILENGLGRVTSSPWQTNPVHPNRDIKVYTWAIDMPKYKKWLLDQPEYAEQVRAARGRLGQW